MSEPPGEQAEPDSGSAETSKLPSLGPNGEGWFLLQIVLFFAIVTAGLVGGGQWAGPLRFGTAVAGGVLILGGSFLVFFGVRDLDRSLSPLPRPKASAVLIQDGIYRQLRHPIYAGVILIAIGWSLLMASFLALGIGIALALLLDLKARREEIWLRERYPGYAEYSLHTKRFVPGLY